MKVYVDRLPKCCEECPCCNNCMDYGCSCNLDDIKLTYDDYANKRHKDCPLQSLADYTKQVRKETITETYEWCCQNHYSEDSLEEHLLNQLQGDDTNA